MPNTASAKKALRQSFRRRVYNLRRLRTMKDLVKDLEKQAKNSSKKGALELLPKAMQAIDKAAKRGIITKNTASRKKARLARLIK